MSLEGERSAGRRYRVSEITIAGNLKDMFAAIVAIENDIELRGNVRTSSIWVNQMRVAGA